jgi:hypothetical protein
VAAHAPGELLIGRGEPRIDAGDGAPVRLIGARRIGIAAALRQRVQRGGDAASSLEIDSSAPSACSCSR